MDPLSSPPGWRSEFRWGVATSVAALLVLIALPMEPVMWLAGLLSDDEGR